jgi:hypothetical protein
MMTDNPYASQFTNLLERRFSETPDGTLAELAYILTPDGLRWLASRRERVSSLDALDQVNSPIREAMVMEPEQLRWKTVQVADYCCSRASILNCLWSSTLTYRRRLRDTSGFLLFGGRKPASMGYRERINWTSMHYSNSQWLRASPFNCRRPKQRASPSSRCGKGYFWSPVSAHGRT